MKKIEEIPKSVIIGEYQYNDFTYKIDEFGRWSIKKKNQIEPTSLFKYYSNNKNSIDAFLNSYFFLSHPFHFNDSMDCSDAIIDFSKLTLKQYSAFYKNFLNKSILEVDLEKRYFEDMKNDFPEIRRTFWGIHSKMTGFLSLSEKPMHPLMWSHYSKEDGFMIEFDQLKFLNRLKNPHEERSNWWLTNFAFAPINYVEKLEQIPIFKEPEWNNPTIPYMYTTNIKQIEWSYENEWRLICFANRNNFGIPYSSISPYPDENGTIERKLYYSKEIINSIVLGKNFFNSNNTRELKKITVQKILL